MSKFGKLTKIATGVSAALLMSYGVTARADIAGFAPSAYAEATLHISNFTIEGVTGAEFGTANFATTGTQFVLGGPTPTVPELAPLITFLTGSVTSQIGATMPGPIGVNSALSINPITVPLGTITHSVAQGPGSGLYSGSGDAYVSYLVNALAAGSFAGARSDHFGNGLQLDGAPPTDAQTQAQVNISQSATKGFANATQSLSTQFLLTIAAVNCGTIELPVPCFPPAVFDVTFDADWYQRDALGQPLFKTNSGIAWNLLVELINPTNGNPIAEVLKWTPDGEKGLGFSTINTCEAANFCAELSDAFTLNEQHSQLSQGDQEYWGNVTGLSGGADGKFGVRAALPAGTYRFSIGHFTTADAEAQENRVPEPATLALLGLGLAGLGFARRKKQ